MWNWFDATSNGVTNWLQGQWDSWILGWQNSWAQSGEWLKGGLDNFFEFLIIVGVIGGFLRLFKMKLGDKLLLGSIGLGMLVEVISLYV
jgi:hypothetical protein